jgi:Spy/CpxP family protein refolding chaperone
MKRIKFLTTIALLASLTFMAGSALAQRGQGKGMMNNADHKAGYCQSIPDLTPDQQAKMETLRTKHIKEVTPLRNELAEKKARLRTLQSADKPDLNSINKVIDEMSAIRANMQKKGAAHRAEISSLLTDDQRVHFNAKFSKRMGNKGNGQMGKGCKGKC